MLVCNIISSMTPHSAHHHCVQGLRHRTQLAASCLVVSFLFVCLLLLPNFVMVSLTLFFLLFSPQTSISLFLQLDESGMHPPLPCHPDYSLSSQLCFLCMAQRASVFQPFPNQALSLTCRKGVCARIHPPASPCTFAPEKAPRPRATGNLPLSTPSNMLCHPRTPPLIFPYSFFISDAPCLFRSHIDKFSLVLIKISLVRPHIDRITSL